MEEGSGHRVSKDCPLLVPSTQRSTQLCQRLCWQNTDGAANNRSSFRLSLWVCFVSVNYVNSYVVHTIMATVQIDLERTPWEKILFFDNSSTFNIIIPDIKSFFCSGENLKQLFDTIDMNPFKIVWCQENIHSSYIKQDIIFQKCFAINDIL